MGWDRVLRILIGAAVLVLFTVAFHEILPRIQRKTKDKEL
jgi:hypothetical protein